MPGSCLEYRIYQVIVIVRLHFMDPFPSSTTTLQELLLLPVRELLSHINSDPTHSALPIDKRREPNG